MFKPNRREVLAAMATAAAHSVSVRRRRIPSGFPGVSLILVSGDLLCIRLGQLLHLSAILFTGQGEPAVAATAFSNILNDIGSPRSFSEVYAGSLV